MARNANKIRIRVAGVLLRDGKILLVKHKKKEHEYWLLPGGGVDIGESLGNALARELWEELRIQASVGNILCINDSISPDAVRHILNVYLWVEITKGDPQLGEDPRVIEFAWHDLDELDKIPLFPTIGAELLALIRSGDKGAAYLGSRWVE